MLAKTILEKIAKLNGVKSENEKVYKEIFSFEETFFKRLCDELNYQLPMVYYKGKFEIGNYKCEDHNLHLLTFKVNGFVYRFYFIHKDLFSSNNVHELGDSIFTCKKSTIKEFESENDNSHNNLWNSWMSQANDIDHDYIYRMISYIVSKDIALSLINSKD